MSRRQRTARGQPTPGAGRPARPPRPGAASLALLVAVAVGCYVNSLPGALLYDDVNAIVRNPAVVELDAGRILATPSWFARGGYLDLYRPVTTASFAVNYTLHGLAPAGYHAVNVALHAAVCVVLALVLAPVTGDARLATLAAFLFAAHPVHTEAVASVVGRAELLAALLALLAWWIMTARGGALWHAVAALAVFLGVLAKENAATLVAVVPAAELIYRRRPDWRACAALALGVGAALVVRTLVMGGVAPPPTRLDNVLATAGPGARLWTAIAVVASYARLLVWPLRLSADYSFPAIPLAMSPGDPRVLLGLGVLAGAGVLAVWGWSRQRHVCFAVVFAALTFSVVSNVVVLIGTTMAERLLYLPSAGFCLLLAVGLGRAGGGGRATLALGAAVVALYAGRTIARNAVWRDAPTFFQAMVADAPRSARSHRELGAVLSDAQRHDEAVAEIETALRLAPDEPVTLYNLGNALARAGRFAEAATAYERALAGKPDLVTAYVNLGNVRSAQGDEAAAEAIFRRGLAIDAGAAELHANLANALLRQGRPAEAEREYAAALRLAPRDAQTRMNYVTLLQGAGRYDEAAEQLATLVQLAPADPGLWIGRVRLLRAAGRTRDADSALDEALRRFPGHAGLRALRATAQIP